MKTTLLFLFTLLPFLSFAQAPTDMVYIPDGHFKWALLTPDFNGYGIIDTNGDGEIEYSEAAAVTHLYLDPSVLNGLNAPNYTNTSQNNNPVEFGPINDLTGIEAFTNLQYLNVRYNNLTTLDLSNNVMLDTLYAEYNQLTTLQLGNNPHLKLLLCTENNIQSLDVTQLTGLIELGCDQNEIDSLDLSNAPNLNFIDCVLNQLTYLDLRNGGNTIGVNATGNPDLTCIYVDDETYAENAPYWYKDSTAYWVETEAECDALSVGDYVFQNINIYPNPVKNKLYISNLTDRSKLSLYDLQGRKVRFEKFKTKMTSFDLSNLEPGIYFLQVTLQNTSKTFKIIKQ